MAFSVRQAIEFFHLLFLRQAAAGADRARLAVKGGCNLRFFFRSIRYSEDLDLDVLGIPKDTLRNKVDRLLSSPALALPLQSQGLSIVGVTAPKQTDTTQRWKVALSAVGQSVALRTKVEFSRRATKSKAEPTIIEPVTPEVTRAYAVQPPILQHYAAPAALVQKVRALVGRRETQARDVFDLQLLRAHLKAPPSLDAELRAQLATAIDRVTSLTHADYLGQVVVYLEPEQAAAYQDRVVWESMQLEVIELLEQLSR